MLIHVKTMEHGYHFPGRQSQSISLNVDDSATLPKLQSIIARRTGIVSREQMIVKTGEQLCVGDSHATDTRTILECGINDGDILHCATRKRG